MIIIIVWLCLVTIGQQVYGKVITVDENGSDARPCCADGACICSSLSKALSFIESNTVINITSQSVPLTTSVSMGSGNISNITITGDYGTTVKCNDTGAVLCNVCSNVCIEGITWDHCGNISHPTSPGISFNTVSNLSIRNCMFQHFKICTAVNITDSVGAINVVNSTFMFNAMSNPSVCEESYYNSLLVISSKSTVISILDSLFFHNGNNEHYVYAAGSFYCYGHYSQQNLEILVNNTSFISNDFRSIHIDDNSMVSLIIFDTVNVSNNDGGAVVFAYGDNSSLKIISSHFANNTLDNLYLSLNNDISISDFYNTTFKDNEVTALRVGSYGGSTIYMSHCKFIHNVAEYGSIVDINVDSGSISQCTFNDNVVHGFGSIVDIDVYSGSISQCTFNDNVVHGFGSIVDIDVYSGSTVNISQCTINNNVCNRSIVYIGADSSSTVKILQCTINGNVGDDNIVYIYAYSEIYVPSDFCNILISSNFTNNRNGSALHVSKCFLKFTSSTLFANNSAENGGAIYIEQSAQITVDDESTVQFINNTALLRGGAMYIDLTSCYNDSIIVFTNFTKYDSIFFTDNLAKLSGNSIYFNIPSSCNVVRNYANNNSAAYIPFKFTYKYSESREVTGSAIATSPYGIKLCSPDSIKRVTDSNNTCGDNKCVNDTGKISMLGQSIYFRTILYDYFNGAAEAIMFQVKCDNCEPKFKLAGDRALVHNELRIKIKFLSDEELKNDTNITLTLASLLPPEYKQLTATLSLTLSSCYNGFSFSSQSDSQCECSNKDKKLMECEGDSASIKLGYWFGEFNNKHTFSLCYHEYCNFFDESGRNETGNGFFNLPREENNQCSPHRTGVACGECSKRYTLAYNSPDCISEDKCSPGMIVLVVLLTALYWITVVAILFGVAYTLNTRQVSLGYLFGMIYFYSIVDILLVTNLHKTDGVFYTAAILSSFAKLNPQFLGRLCFIKNLDAIDQLFIHYCHVVFIAIILIGIVIVAKCNKRVFFYVNHLIVPVTCLLLLFSYTSLTSTSLLLLIPVKLSDEVHAFLSPCVKYFGDRHAAYASVAIFCVLLVTIGFPFLLAIEPFMMKVLNEYLNVHAPKKAKLQIESFIKKKVIVRIKLLLDRLQDCYKDQYRWCAAYYLICRLVIMLITYFANNDYNNMIYYLQTACVIIAMTHIWIQPYKNDMLNVMDAIILLIMLLIVNLSVVNFSTPMTAGIAISLIVAPLVLLFGMAVKKLCLPKIKKFWSNGDGNFNVQLTSFSR